MLAFFKNLLLYSMHTNTQFFKKSQLYITALGAWLQSWSSQIPVLYVVSELNHFSNNTSYYILAKGYNFTHLKKMVTDYLSVIENR
jgi:hypothetical protein